MPSKCPRLNPKMARLQIGVKIQFRSEDSAIKEDSCFMFLSDLRDQDMINICINILETLNDMFVLIVKLYLKKQVPMCMNCLVVLPFW